MMRVDRVTTRVSSFREVEGSVFPPLPMRVSTSSPTSLLTRDTLSPCNTRTRCKTETGLGPGIYCVWRWVVEEHVIKFSPVEVLCSALQAGLRLPCFSPVR